MIKKAVVGMQTIVDVKRGQLLALQDTVGNLSIDPASFSGVDNMVTDHKGRSRRIAGSHITSANALVFGETTAKYLDPVSGASNGLLDVIAQGYQVTMVSPVLLHAGIRACDYALTAFLCDKFGEPGKRPYIGSLYMDPDPQGWDLVERMRSADLVIDTNPHLLQRVRDAGCTGQLVLLLPDDGSRIPAAAHGIQPAIGWEGVSQLVVPDALAA